MKSIWKFPIEVTDRQIIGMPEDAKILSVQTQNGCLFIWALVDTDSTVVTREFLMYGTGHPCASEVSEFIGTFQLEEFVFHLFEQVS